VSKSWAEGSTATWRKVRKVVLVRDGYLCQLRLDGCTTAATNVHHTLGKRMGDDPAVLVAACANCNQKVGDPMAADPQPKDNYSGFFQTGDLATPPSLVSYPYEASSG
jgi:5-methylcytosine-specific restriction endonuclease McrA